MKNKIKLYCDMDGTIINTIACICALYNDDFRYYKKFIPVKWWEVNTYHFEECSCASSKYINGYFNQPRFFRNVTYMDWAKEILTELNNDYEITIVSCGYTPNLKGKKIWIKENLPFCNFIGVNLRDSTDKSNIDMSDGILIDDNSRNLSTSNALMNICFGDEYEWNKDWNGFRCKNWHDVRDFLKGVKF